MARITCACPGTVFAPFRFVRQGPCPDQPTQEDGLCDYCRIADCPTAVDTDEADQRWNAHVNELMKHF